MRSSLRIPPIPYQQALYTVLIRSSKVPRYRCTGNAQTQCMWSDGAQKQNRMSSSQGRGAQNPTTASSTDTARHHDASGASPSARKKTPADRRGAAAGDAREQGRPTTTTMQRRDTAHHPASDSEQGRLPRGSAEDMRRFQDGDEVTMAIEDRGQLVRASFVVRRGQLDRQGRWEYQLWHDNGTSYDGGQWFRETELS
ncbi:hypothetical protein GTA08_BOTSDO12135 [Botryosphaeria dothidea]|uniref:Uncharacterized protein n=1 Tax=Botryosphaeria dothidea TaxID=55169 RepID=A0A8H4NAT9_9PEZI|nr:hypothetical protein GTA08_BOTSDO12135 [Botryosphaeria dothidea]